MRIMSEASTGAVVVGIDMGATNMQFGVVDADNTIIGRARGKTEADRGQDRVINNIVRGIHEACDQAGISLNDLAAIGVAAAGAIDIPRGVILDAPNLNWTDVPLRDILLRELGRPIVLDNDVNGAAWGEHRLGAGRGRGDMLGVWIGTGIGGGLVLDGRIYHGSFFTAGEIGNTIIAPDRGNGEQKLEDRCSRTGMSRALHRLMPQYPDSILHRLIPEPQKTIGSETLAQAYRQGDALIRRVVNQAANLLGVAIANWVTVLSLDTVIIGGGVTEALGEPYMDRIRESFAKHVFPQRCRACQLVMTRLADDAGLLGAALLARDAIASEAK